MSDNRYPAPKAFINPYNFISLKDKKDVFVSDGQVYTGYIDVELEVKNKIIIPLEIENKRFTYYHYPDSMEPVIPGSELRGAVRSMYEALTNSCLSNIEDVELNKRRSVGDKFEFKAIFKKGESWRISTNNLERLVFEAEAERTDLGEIRYLNETYKSFEFVEIDERNIKPIDRSKKKFYRQVTDFRKAKRISKYLLVIGNELKGENDDKAARQASISFYKIDSENLKSEVLSDKRVQNFIQNILSYSPQNAYKRYLERMQVQPANFQNTVMVVSEYELAGKKYLSPSQIGRMQFFNKLSHAYKRYEPCNPKKVCPACNLFGFISKDDDYQMVSKVSFHDFLLAEGASYKIDNKDFISGEPHINNLNFYGNGKSWDDEGSRIRGRKMYFHHDGKDILGQMEEIMKSNPSPQFTSTYSVLSKNDRPLIFEGKVYFENITARQLKNLMFAISFGNNSNYALKVGHAKPYGFGSVNAICKKLYFRSINLDTLEIESIEQDVNKYLLKWSDFDNAELELMTDYNAIKRITFNYNTQVVVCYPELPGDKVKVPVANWFAHNRKEVLPKITENVILYQNKPTNNSNSKNNFHKGNNYRNNNHKSNKTTQNINRKR